VLEIEKDSLCRIKSRAPLSNERWSQGFKIYGIVGIVNIEGFNFLAVIAEKVTAGKLKQGVSIYEIGATKLLPLFPTSLGFELPQSA